MTAQTPEQAAFLAFDAVMVGRKRGAHASWDGLDTDEQDGWEAAAQAAIDASAYVSALEREALERDTAAAQAATSARADGSGPYDGLSPYGIAVTGLELILDLDDEERDWDAARAIASEAATLAVVASTAAAREPQPELANLRAKLGEAAALHLAATAGRDQLRQAVADEIEALEAEAATVRPSKASQVKRQLAGRLAKILEGE